MCFSMRLFLFSVCFFSLVFSLFFKKVSFFLRRLFFSRLFIFTCLFFHWFFSVEYVFFSISFFLFTKCVLSVGLFSRRFFSFFSKFFQQLFCGKLF